MIRVGVVGATGYAGAELVRLLVNHPEVEITTVTSETHKGLAYESVYPAVSGHIERVCSPLDPEAVAGNCDVVFTALPHTKAMECVPAFLEAGKKVVDFSADFRLKSLDVYEKWYAPHTAPQYLADAAYGLPELHREEIKTAALVANPGCYPTGAILGLAPSVKNGRIDLKSIIVNAATGVTGAGRSLKVGSLFCEVNEGMHAYNIGAHRHTPEIEQEVGVLAGSPVILTFAPHLMPLSRGILSTIYATPVTDLDEAEIQKVYEAFYADEPFIRVLPAGVFPDVRNVRGTNLCDISIKADKRANRLIIMTAIDNLVKGAAGQAVHNMNIMTGRPEKEGLQDAPLFL